MRRKILIAFLACMTFVCMVLGAASCSIGSLFGGSKIAFNEGYLEEVALGEPIMLDEYVDPTSMEDYSLILTCDETGVERDLKMLGQWTTDKPGTYTLTYTIHSGANKGTISTKILVAVPKVSWQYSRPTLVYRAGDTMDFNLLKRNLNLVVKSYYNYDFYVQSVEVNGEITELYGKTSYTFKEVGKHAFRFGILTEDGQELTAEQMINVRPQQVLAEGAAEWMEENNITAHDYMLISPDGKVSLEAGYYTSFAKDNVSYLAFNGEEGSGGYGPNTYMMVEFTGKNLPQVAFFCDEATSSFTDGKNGMLFSNGTSFNDGSFLSPLDASRLTIFGPYKAKFAEFDNRGRMLSLGSVAEPCPLSYNALKDGHSYKYIIGIQDASTEGVTARILLIDVTTGERVFDYTQRLTSSSGIGAFKDLGATDEKWNDDYFKGSIVLYGRYGIDLNFDKVHLPITGIDNIYELDPAAQFKDSYQKQYNFNSFANVRDYIDIPVNAYEFTVTDPDGENVAIAEDGSFQYTKSGEYLLKFDPMIEGIRASAVSVRVMYDLENPMPEDFLEQEGVMLLSNDSGLKANTKKDFINEGKQSIEYYAINGNTEGTLILYISKSFTDFIFLASEVDGITFDVYSPRALTYKLHGKDVKLDYTGAIEAETWTTMTITREMCMRNFDVYKSSAYSIAITLTGDSKITARECVYIDNVKLILRETSEIDENVQAFMDANNITAYGYKEINSDMSATLYGGTYKSEWWNLKNDDVPYIAYNGNYGAGSYVVVDFTGKNVPQMALFVDNVTSSLVDGYQGLYVHTGMIKKTGDLVSDTDGGRLTFLGPNKMEFCRPDSDGRVGKQFGTKGYYADGTKDAEGKAVSPLSIRGLEDGVHYRYVIGIKTAREEGATKGRIVLELLLLNLDTNEEVVKYEWSEATEGLKSLIDGGSIVMYSRYNTPITLDKIYAVYTGVSDINAIDKVAEVLA